MPPRGRMHAAEIFRKKCLSNEVGCMGGGIYIDKWSVLFQHFPLCPRSVAYIRFLQFAGPVSIIAFKFCVLYRTFKKIELFELQ